MNRSLTKTTGLILLLLFPIAALAADATAPTAPAVQSAVWTSTDYLKGALTGAIGGLISGFVALVIGWMNNRNALKLNQQKIDADKEALIATHQNHIINMCYEEKKKLCYDLIIEFNKTIFDRKRPNHEEIERIFSGILFICDIRYNEYARQYEHIVNQYRSKDCDEINFCVQLDQNICKNIKLFYNMFVVITQKMLAGEELLPPRRWELKDFEGSIPLDYRKLIS